MTGPDADSVLVDYEVLGLEPIRRPGRVVAVANVMLSFAGAEVLVQGLTIRRQPGGALVVNGPVWKHPATGKTYPALRLPPELAKALADELFTMLAQRAA